MSVVAQMIPKLLDLDTVFERLRKTEPLGEAYVSAESKTKFKLDPDWALSIDATDGNALVGVYMSVNGVERQLTKDAALQAGANFGIPAAYAKKVPAHYIEQLLNYHYSGGMGSNEYKILTVKDNAVAFLKPTLSSYSNIQLLETAVDRIQALYGDGVQIFSDYKFQNTLPQTDIRLIIPEVARVIKDSGMGDLPTGTEDEWSAGVHIANSATAKSQTAIDSYLFRWVCTNGATIQHDAAWSRRGDKEEYEVYEWARAAVEEALEGLETRFNEVQALTALKTAGNTADIVREIFSEYSVPKTQQGEVAKELLDAETLSMYTIMNAITATANDPEIDAARADKLMRIGGDIPGHTFDTIKAQVWDQGHKADPTAYNPYLPVVA